MTTYQRGEEETSPVVETNATSDTLQMQEQIAQQIGERPGIITARLDVTKVLEQMQQGILVTLHIEGPRRFWKKITPQDLGLSISEKFAGVLSDDANKVLTDYFQLGRLSLLPKELQDRLTTVERKARYCLERYSFKTHWGSFVPVTAYQKWKDENTGYEEEFWKIRDELLLNYDDIVKEVLETYRPVAEAAWQMVSVGRSLTNGTSLPSELVSELAFKLEAQSGRDTFVENYLEAIRLAIKPKEKVHDSFKYTIERAYIPLPTDLARDLDEAEQIYGQRVLQDAQLQLELEQIEAARQREQQELQIEQRRQWEEQSLKSQAERDRLRMQIDMERDVIEEARQKKQALVREFFRDVVGPINDMVQEVCSNTLDSFDEHEGQLRGPISRQLRNLVESIGAMNFMGIEEVERQIESIREVLPTKEQSEQAAKGVAKIDTTQITKVVKRVRDEARSVVIELGLIPTVRRNRTDAEPLDQTALIDVTKRQARATPALEEAQEETPLPKRKRKKSAGI